MLQVLEWYALQVRQRTEKLTAQLLIQKGYEPFLPVYLVKRHWSDRVKIFDQPLFPGYLFCRLDPAVRLPVLKTPGVISIVGSGKEPIPVPENEIEAVWRIAKSAASAEPWPYLDCGDNVTISDGPLRGVEGILIAVKNAYKVVVSINLLQRSIAVEVDRGLILPRRIARHLTGRVSLPDRELAPAI
ncbi:MAG TPA: UpxY family transcription antiterminator [Bryobacteraceae bacterium]|jgi:transcription antitermination factor NusG